MFSHEAAPPVDLRVQNLTAALRRLAIPEIDFRWAAVVDYDGLILASYPAELNGQADEAAASTAYLLRLGDNARGVMGFGKWRFTLLAGAEMQQMVMQLNNEMALTIAFGPRTSLPSVFKAVRGVAPELLGSMEIEKRRFSEPNTMLIRREELDRMIQQ